MESGQGGEVTERTRARRRSLALLAIVGIAFLLRAAPLGAQGFWFDEAYTHWIARLPLAESWRAIVADGVHPPLYYAIARAALLIGESEAALRLPSAVFGALTVAVVFWLGERWASATAGWLAAALLAVSPIHVWYSGDARMYALLVLLGSCCMLAYTSWRARPRLASAAALVVSSALVYLTHYFALFLPLVQFVHLGLHLRDNPRAIRTWAGLQALAAVPLAGWIVVLSQREAQTFGIGWIPAPSLSDLFGTLVNFSTGSLEPLAAWQSVVAIVVGILAVLGLRGAWREPGARSFALLWLMLPPLFAWGLSLRRPVYMDRFLLICLPPLLLLVGRGISLLPRRAVGVVAAILVVVTGLAMIRFCLRPGQVREQWREAAVRLEQASPGEAIVVRVLQIVVPLSYYYHGPLPLQALEVNRRMTSLSDLAEGHAGVWLVYWNAAADIHRVTSDPPFRPEDEADEQAASWLAGGGPPLLERADYVGVTLLHFGASP